MLNSKAMCRDIKIKEWFVLDYECYICHVRLKNVVGASLRINLIFKICYGKQPQYAIKSFALYVPFDYQKKHIYAYNFVIIVGIICSVYENHRL